jgi:glyceraldehyde 3-phosphate dehydrogenase
MGSKIKVGIMGFGSIGRDFYRLSLSNSEVEVKVICDLGDKSILHYLIDNDDESEHQIQLEGNYLVSNGKKTRLIQAKRPSDVPWDVFGVDVVVDATHKYCSKDEMQEYIDAGAKRVVISALPRDEIDNIVIMGVNDDEMNTQDKLISAGSSTTNAFALMLNILDEAFGLEKSMMTTIHAYTSDQPLHDMIGKDFRRSRSAAENIIPNDTPAPKWIEKILPNMKGKIDGIALNVPVANGSLLDMTTEFKSSNISIDDVNEAVIKYSLKFPNIIETTPDPIVSSDVIGNSHSMLFDIKGTMKSKSTMVKTLCWYDNGFSQASRILDIILAYKKLDVEGGK